MYHPAGMRRAGPILIVLIGVVALFINFFPSLTLPDATSPSGSRSIETKLGLDLSGGLRVEYQAQPVEGRTPSPADMAIIKDIVERRVNQTGVSEPVVVTQGSDRVVVELPGVTDPDAVRRLVGQTGRLDFVPLGQTQAQEGQILDLKLFPPLFSGDQVQSASIGQDQNGGLTVDFVLKGDGAKLFGDYTAEHIGDYFAITLDGTVISAPVIQNSIPNGQVQISSGGIGGFPATEANNLVTVLKFGSLPFPILELSSEQISATLGDKFLAQSLHRRVHRHRDGDHLHGHLLPGHRADRQLRAAVLHARRLRHLPAHPGDPDAGRHRRLRPVGRHGRRREHPHLRADEGRAAGGQVAARPPSRRASTAPGTRSSTRTCRA